MLAVDGKNITVELFEASLWPNVSSADGEYRVRIDGKWYCAAGKYTFLSWPSVGAILARLLSGQEEFKEDPPPVFEKFQRVRVWVGECDGDGVPRVYTGGFVAAPPLRGIDGRWYVAVTTFDGTAHYPIHDVDALEARRVTALADAAS